MTYVAEHNEGLLMDRLGSLNEPCELVVSPGAEALSSPAMLDLVDYLVSLAPNRLSRRLQIAEESRSGPTLHIVSRAHPSFGTEFWGVPSGHEFLNVIDSLELATGRIPSLDPVTTALLGQMTSAVTLKVFVTPT